MKINISDAKANLTKLVDRAYHGERIVIMKNNVPLVDLVPHQPQGKRRLGVLLGQIEIPADFDSECDEINEMFYGDDG